MGCIVKFQLRKLYLVARYGKITVTCGLYKTWKDAVVASWEWRSRGKIQETAKRILTVGIVTSVRSEFLPSTGLEHRRFASDS